MLFQSSEAAMHAVTHSIRCISPTNTHFHPTYHSLSCAYSMTRVLCSKGMITQRLVMRSSMATHSITRSATDHSSSVWHTLHHILWCSVLYSVFPILPLTSSGECGCALSPSTEKSASRSSISPETAEAGNREDRNKGM